MNASNRRPGLMKRTYIVDRIFQAKFMFGLTAFSVVYSVVIGFILHFAVDEVIQDSLYRSHQRSGDVWSLIWPTLINTNLLLATYSAGIFALAVLVMVIWVRHSLLIIGNEVRAIDGPAPIAIPPVSLSIWSNDAEEARQRVQERFLRLDDVAGHVERSAAILGSEKTEPPNEDAFALSRIELTAAIDLLDSTFQNLTGPS